MACGRFRMDLSAFVDGTLSAKRQEQIYYHIAGCAQCRDEVHEIAVLCSKLSGCRDSVTPGTLTSKLESIAGEQAQAPLYMAKGQGKLPTARRRWLAAQGGCALLAVMVSVVALAVLVAPDPVRIPDPVGSAREQYARSSAAMSVNEALAAMLLAREWGADFGDPVKYTSPAGDTTAEEIDTREAATLLTHAVDPDLSLTGVQQVYVADTEAQYLTAEVKVTKVRDQGTQLAVVDAQGHQFVSTFLPDAIDTLVEAPARWSFIRYTSAWEIAGRSATRVAALGDGQLVASWWVDAETGLLLWAERYDSSGAVSVALGYTELTHEAAPLDETSYVFALQPVTSSGTAGWCVGLDVCPQELGGLPLVAFTSADHNGTSSMSLVYSDGVDTAVVAWMEGVLAEGATTRTDAAAGLPSVLAWQKEDLVVTLATDASSEVMADMVAGLPEPESYRRSFAERTISGLKRLLGIR